MEEWKNNPYNNLLSSDKCPKITCNLQKPLRISVSSDMKMVDTGHYRYIT